MRPEGFGRRADVAVDLLDDDRILDALEAAGHRALTAYLAVVLGSWGRGERLTLRQSARRSPAAWGLLEGLPELLPALIAVGLLDVDGRIPKATWASWYGPAATRYATRVDAGRRGGRTAADSRRGSGTTSTTTSPTSTPHSVTPSHREVGMGGSDVNAPAPAPAPNGVDDDYEFDPDLLNGIGGYRKVPQ